MEQKMNIGIRIILELLSIQDQSWHSRLVLTSFMISLECKVSKYFLNWASKHSRSEGLLMNLECYLKLTASLWNLQYQFWRYFKLTASNWNVQDQSWMLIRLIAFLEHSGPMLILLQTKYFSSDFNVQDQSWMILGSSLLLLETFRINLDCSISRIILLSLMTL